MSDPRLKLVTAMAAVGAAINRTLEETAGCEVAFIVIAAPITDPSGGLMFTNTDATEMEFAVQTVLNAIRKKRQPQTFIPPAPSTRQH